MDDLAPHDFAAYFEAIHNHRPFPWQLRLLEQVASEGRWPALLDLPTGTGKTAAIDVAVFHLALDAARPFTQRRAPRRIVMVVDRRTVVDQGFVRAKTIAAALYAAKGGVLGVVRDRLCSLTGTSEPLACAQLRGGMPRDDAWARRPDQPLVAVSTVDQVGSRLLFRGYGVSDAMRPIHAGLLGHDTLLLLDEVHLSQPFLETLEAIRRYRTWGKTVLPDRWQFVAMSATPGRKGVAFGLTDEDRRDETLGRRLRAAKPIEHAVVKVAGGEAIRRTKFAEECAKYVESLAKPGRAVGVVVNRVATALEVFKLIKDRDDQMTFVVSGRMRPLDRNDLDKTLSRLVRSGRPRDTAASPIVVVATQCIEAGADFDFDALVTECASLDALRQRFGRLNRLGEIEDARGVILVRADVLGGDDSDFVYGHALRETWHWIEQGSRDFGIQSMDASLPPEDELTKMLPPRSRAPVMLPAHLDAWTQTTPSPRPDPDVSLWLHGVDQKRDADVQIVWRADMSAALISQAAPKLSETSEERQRHEKALAALRARLDACPPTGLEALAIPIGAARAWLAGTPSFEVADVEGSSEVQDDQGHRAAQDSTTARWAFLWNGDGSVVIRAADLHPGMTIVVPSTYGGLADGTWDPSSTEPVADLGDRARWERSGRPTLRLHPALMKLIEPSWDPPAPSVSDDPNDDEAERVADWLKSIDLAGVPEWVGEVVRAMKTTRSRPDIVHLDAVELDGHAFELAYLCLVGRTRIRADGMDVSTEDDGASYTGKAVTLDAHMKGVKTWAGWFAKECGLFPALIGDIEIAARWHDAGKVDPRFQRMLRGGSPLSEGASEPLAKSRIIAADRATRVRARELSKYPKGARHELSSISLLQKDARLMAEATDQDLVLHLVASHHGWCRPFAPAIDDPEPVELTLDADGTKVHVSSQHDLSAFDSGIADRFWQLVERYGWFGLAWLEAILRLADHRRSEDEQRPDFADREPT